MSTAAKKKPESGIRPRTVLSDMQDTKTVVDNIQAIRDALTAILQGPQGNFFVRALTTPKEVQERAEEREEKGEEVVEVGSRYYSRVSGDRRRHVEVIDIIDHPRRPYKLKDVETGRVLQKTRSKAALHIDTEPLPFPPRPKAR